VSTAQLKNGTSVTLRPIRPEDEPLLSRFHETLSERTVYLRYLEHLKLDQRTSHQRLARICFIDYDREVVLVAEREDEKGQRAIVAVGRLNRTRSRDQAEFALLVADAYQGRGLGLAMLKRLLEIARPEGIRRVTAEIAHENGPMQAVCRKLGFRFKDEVGEPTLRAAIDL
jgi:acetyltransferase